MQELLKISTKGGDSIVIDVLSDFEFDEDFGAKILSSIIYSLSATLDEGVNAEQFQAEILSALNQEMMDGGFGATLKIS